jgi:hypothetical protein
MEIDGLTALYLFASVIAVGALFLAKYGEVKKDNPAKRKA